MMRKRKVKEPTKPPTKLGRYILSQTKEKGIDVNILGDITGLGHPILSSYIRGRHVPRVENVIIIAEGLSILQDRDPFEIALEIIRCYPNSDNTQKRWEKRLNNIEAK